MAFFAGSLIDTWISFDKLLFTLLMSTDIDGRFVGFGRGRFFASLGWRKSVGGGCLSIVENSFFISSEEFKTFQEISNLALELEFSKGLSSSSRSVYL